MSEVLVERIVIRGITVYRFHKNSRAAVDDYINLAMADFEAHVDAGRLNQPMFFIIDVSRSTMYPMNYMNQQIKNILIPKFIALKPATKLPVSYIAYITASHSDAFVINLLKTMTRRQVENTRKIFKADELDNAIDWLLEERQHHNSVLDADYE